MQEINILEELFLSTDMWGWFGPIIIIVVSFMILANKKYKPLGVFFIIIESLLTYTYYDLALTTPWYYWNAFIMVIGVILCMFQIAR